MQAFPPCRHCSGCSASCSSAQESVDCAHNEGHRLDRNFQSVLWVWGCSYKGAGSEPVRQLIAYSTRGREHSVLVLRTCTATPSITTPRYLSLCCGTRTRRASTLKNNFIFDTIIITCQHNSTIQPDPPLTLELLHCGVKGSAGQPPHKRLLFHRTVYCSSQGGVGGRLQAICVRPRPRFQRGIFSWKIWGICHQIEQSEGGVPVQGDPRRGRKVPAVFGLCTAIVVL